MNKNMFSALWSLLWPCDTEMATETKTEKSEHTRHGAVSTQHTATQDTDSQRSGYTAIQYISFICTWLRLLFLRIDNRTVWITPSLSAQTLVLTILPGHGRRPRTLFQACHPVTDQREMRGRSYESCLGAALMRRPLTCVQMRKVLHGSMLMSVCWSLLWPCARRGRQDLCCSTG